MDVCHLKVHFFTHFDCVIVWLSLKPGEGKLCICFLFLYNRTKFYAKTGVKMRKNFFWQKSSSKIKKFSNGTGRRIDYLEMKSPYGKEHGRSLGAPN